MSVTPIERMKIINYIKTTPFPTKTYGDLLLKMDRKKALGAQTIDLIEFLINYTYKETTQEKVSENLLRRELIIMFDVFNQINNIDSLLSEEQKNKLKIIFSFCQKENIDNEDIIAYSAKIAELLRIKIDVVEGNILKEEQEKEDKIKGLEKLVESLQKDLQRIQNDLEGQLEKAKNSNEEFIVRNRSLKKQITDLQKELEERKEEIKAKTNKVEDLEAKLERLKKEIESLKTNHDNDLNTISELQRKITVYENNVEVEIRIQRIADIIIRLLLQNKFTEYALKEELNNNSIVLQEGEYLKAMKIVKSKMSISTTIFNGQKNYSIQRPLYYTNQVLNLGADTSCIDILLVSDFHIDNDTDIEEATHTINDYASQNGISLIVDMGDFLGFRTKKEDLLTRYENGCRLVERCINLFPRVDGVYHAILGGNHDKDSFDYGCDLLKELTDNREDFIYLGYDSAILSVNGIISNKTSFLLHHLQKRLKDPLDASTYDTKYYKDYLSGYYSPQEISLNNFFITLIGGAHMNGVYNNFALVPSFMNDRKFNGAFHIRAFLNEKMEIKNMVIINLINCETLVPVSEVYYKK